MHFENGGIYHIYNQGNDKQKIFFCRDNYLYFLKKIKLQVLPFADILAWCLMPNHFHLMVYVCETEIQINPGAIMSINSPGVAFSPGAWSRTRTKRPRTISLNHSIGILLASYTRAINKREGKTGSLFRQESKSVCLNEINWLSNNWIVSSGITYLNVHTPGSQYAQICFNYIHNNPVKAHLTKTPADWEFSSYLDIAGIRNGKLVNKDRIKEFGLKL